MATHGAFPWDQGNQEGDSEKWHLCFRAFSWEGPDPVQNLRRLLELCRRWLRPDLLSKEEMVELVALEQLMISAPEDVQVQVRESGVRSCRDLEELLRGHGRPVQPSIVIYQGQKFLVRDEDFEMADTEASEQDVTIDLSTSRRSLEDTDLLQRSQLSRQLGDLAGTEWLLGGQGGPVPLGTSPEEGEPEVLRAQQDLEEEPGEARQEASALECREPALLQGPGPVVTPDSRKPQHNDTAAENEAAAPAATRDLERGDCAELVPGGDPQNVRASWRRRPDHTLSQEGVQGGAVCPREQERLNSEEGPSSSKPAPHSPSQEAARPALHECGACSKTFQYRSQLVIHKRSHTGERPFRCDQCKKGFMQQSDLRVHRRIHTGERPFCCRLCPKAFTHESTLLGHVRVHTREQPYACKHCGKCFSHRGNLNVHMRIHTQTRPYPCHVCGHTFRQLGTMKRHCKVHAKSQPQDVPAGPQAEPQGTE